MVAANVDLHPNHEQTPSPTPNRVVDEHNNYLHHKHELNNNHDDDDDAAGVGGGGDGVNDGVCLGNFGQQVQHSEMIEFSSQSEWWDRNQIQPDYTGEGRPDSIDTPRRHVTPFGLLLPQIDCIRFLANHKMRSLMCGVSACDGRKRMDMCALLLLLLCRFCVRFVFVVCVGAMCASVAVWKATDEVNTCRDVMS